ncbi:MAG: NAD(P)/FAD-dependent oxidoreductase [Deltaproteobacteria bacterium]|nr:MAG: NAD(P)/FAD-dependent oxidoreductase [Deltaproteobacteria bacterium]
MSAETTFDAVIIGAGAAGLMCGATAGQRGRKVLLLEGSPRVGQKISISGGGRCNFTNLRVEPKNYLSENPHFCKSALSRFTPLDFIKLIEKHGIAYHEKAPGQLFCNDRAHRIVDLLKAECKAGGVILKTGCAIKRIEKKDVFSVQTDSAAYAAPALVVATGGLSYPGAGATGFGYEIAAQFGLAVIACKPALVPLTYQPADLKRYGSLSGISIIATATTGSTSFTDAILFTHKGLSGPAILQLSSYWTPGAPITLDLLPHLRLEDAILKWKSERPKAELKTLLREHLPERLAHCFLDLHGQNRPARQLTERDAASVARMFHQWQIQPRGTEGYGKAEVTRGGIDTRELSSKTFESRKVPGLYFIGEVLDVTGWLGGYNFQWAWASGHCAGLFV